MGDGTENKFPVWADENGLANGESEHGEQSLEETVMNRNRKCSKKVAAGIAVGMAAVMSATPVWAAEESASVSKEETVYVNADASGNKESVTVSSWLKNAGSEKEL